MFPVSGVGLLHTLFWGLVSFISEKFSFIISLIISSPLCFHPLFSETPIAWILFWSFLPVSPLLACIFHLFVLMFSNHTRIYKLENNLSFHLQSYMKMYFLLYCVYNNRVTDISNKKCSLKTFRITIKHKSKLPSVSEALKTSLQKWEWGLLAA